MSNENLINLKGNLKVKCVFFQCWNTSSLMGWEYWSSACNLPCIVFIDMEWYLKLCLFEERWCIYFLSNWNWWPIKPVKSIEKRTTRRPYVEFRISQRHMPRTHCTFQEWQPHLNAGVSPINYRSMCVWNSTHSRICNHCNILSSCRN